MSKDFAAITLGSNSFNMLVATLAEGVPQVVAKYKQKVRLASGIDTHGTLSEAAIKDGLACLAMFADKLNQHQITHVKVIATATLRLISNSNDFCQQALKVLPFPIEIISGDKEAELIYLGMFHHTQGEHRRLVIDIGGASTEFIIGDGERVLYKKSLPIGCVSYLTPHFSHFPHKSEDFDSLALQVKQVLAEHLAEVNGYGCHDAVGASGTIQTIMELLRHRGHDERITLAFLEQMKQEILAQTCSKFSEIEGLTEERAPTLATGVAILLALFELLELQSINLSGGALREGVLQLLAQESLAQYSR
ncbi:exopolyphosphatase [Shewanella sp. 202IG2-18]|uniref:Ppx/GppA phosphatase family protein n=1 Tax=Parashewanella hymeniacidonis TaxID=2807618 RepID=UPI0019618D01|nr:exopolyphosphatase [Parashewanella hymeniacidonis]MBM7073152.1 exopolyphosphatase [Parashewanella hymeniacidonis]